MLRWVSRPVSLAVALAAGALSAAATVEFVQRVQDFRYQAPFDLGLKAADLHAQGLHDDAVLLAEFVLAHPAAGDRDAAARTVLAAGRSLASPGARVRSFAHGMVTGEPRDAAGMLGSLTLDLFVIGDLRDIAVQGWRQWHHGDGDRLILALSGVGLAAAAAPHLHAAPAVLKVAHRSGSLSPGLARTLRDAGPRALASSLDDAGRAALALGPAPFRTALRSVDSTADLQRLSRAARVDRQATYAWVSARGNGGLARVATDGTNIRALARSLKFGSRGIKSVRKAWSTIPGTWLGLIAAVSGLLCATALRSAFGPRVRVRVTHRTA